MTATATTTTGTDPVDIGPAVDAEDLLDLLVGLGHRVFTGVPCSLLDPLYRALEGRGTALYAAAREDLAIGLATGAALAGRRPTVLMQNSGLAGSVSALLSLPKMYRVPMTLFVSWRGHGPDAPEHVELGAKTTTLVELAGLRWTTASRAAEELPGLVARPEPVAVLVRPGELS